MGKTLNIDELNNLYNEVIDIVNNCNDYYLFTSAGDAEWSKDGSYVSFTVDFSSSRTGYNWNETWYVYNNGSISGEDRHYDSIDDLRASW